jgi:hypothetical protein
VFHERHKPLVAQLQDAHAYDPDRRRKLDALVEESTSGLVAPLETGAHDHLAWATWGNDLFGRPWSDAPFLWAESYFYRRLLDAVGFYSPGAWFWIDPFEPKKAAELSATTVSRAPEGLPELLLASTWGNRADLGFRITHAADPDAGPGTLIIDERASVLDVFQRHGLQIAVVADNAAEELITDLFLIDHLLTTGIADHVDLHIKPVPYYVSDATAGDVWATLRALASEPATADIAHRLTQAATTARLELVSHWFYTSPLSYHHLPSDLADQLATYSLVVFKGDLNYRRLVGDYTWPATTSFVDAVGYLADNVVALRTLKSDVVVGLDPATERQLDQSGLEWRTSGTHALIQTNLWLGARGSSSDRGFASWCAGDC